MQYGTLLESPFCSESKSVIFNFVHLNSHMLWAYNYVILIAIGMYAKPCIGSLAFKACNWELLCNTGLNIAT